jgi:hypothetical protein
MEGAPHEGQHLIDFGIAFTYCIRRGSRNGRRRRRKRRKKRRMMMMKRGKNIIPSCSP